VSVHAVESGDSAREFLTTQWSVVLSCSGEEEEKAKAALSQLCRTYWRPIFTFICRRGFSVSDAQDLTQDFFMIVLNRSLLHSADPMRGRFRSLLLKSLQNFLIDADKKRNAGKRGGGVDFVLWDDWMAEAPSQLCFPTRILETWPAERLYDLRWAATVVEQALRRLSEECESRGRRRVFDTLQGHLVTERSDISYEELAVLLGVKLPDVKRLAHQMRARYRTILREEVARTVDSAAEIEEEIRYLCAVLAMSET
jgi:DNA-directed RNA polymerase specialized sigma24 family protein